MKAKQNIFKRHDGIPYNIATVLMYCNRLMPRLNITLTMHIVSLDHRYITNMYMFVHLHIWIRIHTQYEWELTRLCVKLSAWVWVAGISLSEYSSDSNVFLYNMNVFFFFFFFWKEIETKHTQTKNEKKEEINGNTNDRPTNRWLHLRVTSVRLVHADVVLTTVDAVLWRHLCSIIANVPIWTLVYTFT